MARQPSRTLLADPLAKPRLGALRTGVLKLLPCQVSILVFRAAVTKVR